MLPKGDDAIWGVGADIVGSDDPNVNITGENHDRNVLLPPISKREFSAPIII